MFWNWLIKERTPSEVSFTLAYVQLKKRKDKRYSIMMEYNVERVKRKKPTKSKNLWSGQFTASKWRIFKVCWILENRHWGIRFHSREIAWWWRMLLFQHVRFTFHVILWFPLIRSNPIPIKQHLVPHII